MTTTEVTQESQQVLRQGILDIALKFAQGVDRRGKPYGWMWDCRELLLQQPYLKLAARALWQRLKPYAPTMVGGMTMAANPLTIALLYESEAEGYPLEGLLIRREPKGDGLRRLVEGPAIKPGARVVLVDDLINSGETQRQALAALEPFDCQVVAIGSLLNLQRGGEAWIHAQGIAIEALFTARALGMATAEPSAPRHLQVAWKFGGLNRADYLAPKSTAAIGPEGIYVGADRGFVVALTLEGQERWRYEVRDRVRGVHSSPLAHAGKVYFGAYDGFLYCVDAERGELVWELNAGQWIGSSPTLDEPRGVLYVGVEFGEAGGSLIAVDLETGERRWSHPAGHYVHATPVVDAERAQVLFGANDHCLRAVDAATGELRWKFVTKGEIKGAAAVADGVVFVGSFDGNLYALDAESGALLWERRLGSRLYTTPLISSELVVVGSYSSRVVALERRTGRVAWVATTGEKIVGGVIAVGADRLAVGSTDGRLYVLERSSGKVLDVFTTGGAILGTPSLGQGLLTIASTDGALWALRT